jgi:hypothetical protein
MIAAAFEIEAGAALTASAIFPSSLDAAEGVPTVVAAIPVSATAVSATVVAGASVLPHAAITMMSAATEYFTASSVV